MNPIKGRMLAPQVPFPSLEASCSHPTPPQSLVGPGLQFGFGGRHDMLSLLEALCTSTVPILPATKKSFLWLLIIPDTESH